MRNFKKYTVAIFTTTALAFSVAQAQDAKEGGIFLEPALTYEQGEMTVSYPTPFKDSTEKTAGLGLGLRMGYHAYQTIFVAVDGRYSMPKYDSQALGSSADATAYNLAATLGMQTPFAGVRVWGSYIFDGKLDPKELSNSLGDVDAEFSGQTGFRVGAGLYVAVVSVNLEYQDTKYGTTTLSKAGPFAPGTYSGIDGADKKYILSVSFPMAL